MSEPHVPAPNTATPRPKRPWRDNLEAFGVAILAAVLLKPMVIEAYQIPTSSMQPTLMGSPEAGVYDRILVNKLRYEVFEPKRWDIVVFRYPIRRNQNYVKRIVGVGGDRLRVAGGNLWEVGEDGEIAHVNRKPDRVQNGLWKNIFPGRLELDKVRNLDATALGEFFEGTKGSLHKEGDGLRSVPSPKGTAQLMYTDLRHRGLANQVYDGYPGYIAVEIQRASSAGGNEGVQDIRMGFDVTPEDRPTSLSINLKLQPAGQLTRVYQLAIAGGKGRLRIEVDGVETAASEPFDCALDPGEQRGLSFAHIDDRLVAWVDGTEVASLEVGANRVVQLLDPSQVTLYVDSSGGKVLHYSDITVERDLHYVQTGLDEDLANLVPEGKPRAIQHHIIEVPEGHFFMMGDNTLASADSRQWLVLEVGMTEDGWLVDPRRAGKDGVKAVTGNKRPWGLNTKPDPDENPVIVRAGDPEEDDLFAFTDSNGEVYSLRGKLGRDYDPTNMELLDPKAGDARWKPPEHHIYFVPREHVLGRPLTGFWPIILPFRLGFIR